MSSQKKLVFKIVFCVFLLLFLLGFYFYQRYHPLLLPFSSIKKITITTTNHELYHSTFKELTITDKEPIQDLLKSLQNRFFYDTYSSGCMCARHFDSITPYKIVMNDTYEILLSTVTSAEPFIHGELIKKNQFSIYVDFPSSFVDKIKEILPLE